MKRDISLYIQDILQNMVDAGIDRLDKAPLGPKD